ncbi:putative toxin-antitoxin system toxin component, PIN family [candidate division WWE3 bacterium CG09_land_8_20_14_0_10_39_24]|uniref:Putative toxin-antitoxin system toxin component, PIN family n=1 Tax=candidate division WWE3 bacterium CG09_land_8_20_14_0_10_39_24 TaxID=1975088 RepID=A0A2H0WK03_UNCKA|nr:MAG: putative toxin-antitoxin system toxin component, PIN family [bacterium CG09_39_24]PIS13023.1 MAG: putative toxin-antitoxin system toxin component, PIN family [candidate division WWE3 bacterium CG09_land_8_20_14_0_10_39_24]PJE51805.1 MAG: putative toxin-antitoxin system toxin component, PIN family [candidate division WWE3 bacterium CG10_big_fil_rev_8_21_14_0_10_39_14]
MIKAVLDTNVYISAIIFGGNPRAIIELCINNMVDTYTSSLILLEIAKKLQSKFLWNRTDVALAIKTISKTSKVIVPQQKFNVVNEDPTDNKIIECAVAASASFIVTGDRHLLSLEKFKGIKIVSPKDFLSFVS